MCFIALDRYLCVVHNYTSEWSTLSAIALAVCWLLSLISAFFPIWGLNSYVLRPSGIYCIGEWSERGVNPMAWTITSAFVSVFAVLFISFCYIRIFAYHRTIVSAVAGHADAPIMHAKEISLAKKMLIIVTAFATCWVCYDVLFWYELISGSPADRWWDAIAITLVLLNATLNPILYAILDPRYRISSWTEFVLLFQCSRDMPRVSDKRESHHASSHHHDHDSKASRAGESITGHPAMTSISMVHESNVVSDSADGVVSSPTIPTIPESV